MAKTTADDFVDLMEAIESDFETEIIFGVAERAGIFIICEECGATRHRLDESCPDCGREA